MDTTLLNSLISDLALILILGSVATVLFKKLKQPVVLGYIVAGFIASPHFSFFPSVVHESNIDFWAQIGIIVLLFSIGLDFSFKKLLNVGGSAAVTALIIVLGMMGLGFVVGRLLHFSAVNAMFLGGMLSMSSTTIIIKALDDLKMRQRRFVPLVLAVLIVEDLFAVVLLVILSSVAKKNVQGEELMKSVLTLSGFLIIWFTVGIFLIPSVFKRFRNVISDELMLVISMALCFFMAVFSVKSGFSLALGAFVMGSILAGTVEAERIERLITPVKDLFGAVFFISVGMMVNPQVIVQHAGTIALFSAVVVVGMITFGTFGMLATGQPLKIAMESGFCLTQIGEFSFIIATTGVSLGVLDTSLYAIIVAVSVITTFFTPFFIKRAIPCYNFVSCHLPGSWSRLLEGYSKNATESETSETRQLWRIVFKRYALRLVLYSVIVIALIVVSHTYWVPLMRQLLGRDMGRLVGVASTIAAMSPFLYAIILPSTRADERKRLVAVSGRVTYVPLIMMSLLGVVVSMMFVTRELYGIYRSTTAVTTAVTLTLMFTVLLSPRLTRHMRDMERRFISNANERENHRTGRDNNLVSDMHLAYMRVGYSCPFVGETLKSADLRRRYGVNVVNIQRNSVLYPVPTGDTRVFPGDVIGVIGTDEQIQRLLPMVEDKGQQQASAAGEARFMHFAISDASPLVGKTLAQARLREDYASLLVAVQRAGDNYLAPTPDIAFAAGDVLWIVGDAKRLAALKK